MNEDERDDDSDTPEVFDKVQTICHFCGGGGMVADPKLAIIGGEPRTVDNGRPCLYCTDGRLPDIVPPV